MQGLDKKIKRVQEAVNKGNRLGANEAESIIKEMAIEYQQISKLKQSNIDEFNTAIGTTYSRKSRYDYKNMNMPTNNRVGGQANTIITSYLKDAAFYIIRMNAQSLGIDNKANVAQTVQTIFSTPPTTDALFPNKSNQNVPNIDNTKNETHHLSHTEKNTMNYNLYPFNDSKHKHPYHANDDKNKTHSTNDKKTNAYYYNTDNSKTKHSYLSPDEYNEWYPSKPKIIRNNEGCVGYMDREKGLVCIDNNRITEGEKGHIF